MHSEDKPSVAILMIRYDDPVHMSFSLQRHVQSMHKHLIGTPHKRMLDSRKAIARELLVAMRASYPPSEPNFDLRSE